jgi:hypothetical protein
VNLFIGIFTALVSGWKSYFQSEYATGEHQTEAATGEIQPVLPASEPTIGYLMLLARIKYFPPDKRRYFLLSPAPCLLPKF